MVNSSYNFLYLIMVCDWVLAGFAPSQFRAPPQYLKKAHVVRSSFNSNGKGTKRHILDHTALLLKLYQAKTKVSVHGIGVFRIFIPVWYWNEVAKPVEIWGKLVKRIC